MNSIPFILFAALAAFTTRVAAESCYLSTACVGEEICINQECTPPPGNLESCTVGEDCEWGETCHDGYCKPGGVNCSNVAGSGNMRVSGGEINCMSGSGVGWENGMDCDSVGDTPNCTTPDINDLTDMELEEMYEDCVTQLTDECGSETPDPEETCTPEALQLCTDWSTFIAEVDANCEDGWGSMTVESPVRNNDDSVDGEPDVDTVLEDGEGEVPDEPEVSETGNGDSEDDVPRISGLFSQRGLSNTANPWFVIECCEAMEQEDEREEIEMVQGMIESCAAALSASDCDSFERCVENYYEENGYSGSEGTVSSTGGDDRDATDEIAKEQNAPTDDSGCSIATPGRSATSLLFLLF